MNFENCKTYRCNYKPKVSRYLKLNCLLFNSLIVHEDCNFHSPIIHT